MTAADAVGFVRRHGVVLEGAAGPVPSLAAAVAGANLRGNWWGHAKGRQIFALTRAVRNCPDVLVCRLIDGKITYVHRRLWPALVRVSDAFPRRRLARIHEQHTDTGRHVVEEHHFPGWTPEDVAAEARRLDEEAAFAALGAWCRR